MTVSILQDLISGSKDGTPTAFDATKTSVSCKAVMSNETARDPANKFAMYVLARYSENGDWVIERKITWVGDPADDPFHAGQAKYPSTTVSFASNKPLYINTRLEIGEGVAMSVGTDVTIS